MEEAGIETSEIHAEAEEKNKIYKDTVRLSTGEFIHIETSRRRLQESFGDFAEHFGRNREEAKSFFHEHVDFELCEPSESQIEDTRLRKIFHRVINMVPKGLLGGAIKPIENGNYRLMVNIAGLGANLEKINFNYSNMDSFQVKEYSKMSEDVRIAAYKQLVQTATEHEFYHLIQAMEKPEDLEKYIERKKISRRFFVLFLATAAALRSMESICPGLQPVLLPTFGLAFHYLVRSEKLEVEKDAYEAQKKAKDLELKSPYDFMHER